MRSLVINKLRFFLLFLILLTVISCKKERQEQDALPIPEVQMEYFNFNNREIKAGTSGFSVDLNHDGRKDIAFSTLLVGDPINQVDKFQFLVQSNIKVNLPVKVGEEIPVMKNGDLIPLSNFEGYQWFELSSIILVQKIISFTQPPVWEGHWKSAVHRYLPYQIVGVDGIYNGWVELTVDIANEKVVLHKAAISRQPNKISKAGI